MIETIKGLLNKTNSSVSNQRLKILSIYIIPTIIFSLITFAFLTLVVITAASIFINSQGSSATLNTVMIFLMFIAIFIVSLYFSASLEFALTSRTRDIYRNPDTKINGFQDFFLLTRSDYLFQFLMMYFVRSVFIVLWTCLLLFPGIYKSISYSQSTFIFLDKMEKQKEISATECITQSRKMMNGYFLVGFVWMLILGLILNAVSILFSLIFREQSMTSMSGMSGSAYQVYEYITMILPSGAVGLLTDFSSTFSIINLVWVLFMYPFYYMGLVVFNEYLIYYGLKDDNGNPIKKENEKHANTENVNEVKEKQTIVDDVIIPPFTGNSEYTTSTSDKNEANYHEDMYQKDPMTEEKTEIITPEVMDLQTHTNEEAALADDTIVDVDTDISTADDSNTIKDTDIPTEEDSENKEETL
ncbi:hypothetical protein [Mycoplasma sp. P36-A1]|uniref:hypothetical protein n=1 Tax=Mycoplasma sp. P36-A1 TaxID=3252900 RepID=UPI003C2B32C4